jgi:D-alanine-D-alanine ligase
MTAKGPRVAVVYNEPVLPAGHPDAISEADVVLVAKAVGAALAVNGFEPELVAAGPPLGQFLERLTRHGPALVFNLAEGFGGTSAGATYLTGMLELLDVPYTGAPVEALAVCQSKSRTKAVLKDAGLPTARSVLIAASDSMPSIVWDSPMIVKPDGEDGSLGIAQASVVTSPAGLEERVERLRRDYGGAVLIESYLPGPEFNVGLVAAPDLRALPVAQVLFAPKGNDWPILTYDAKWDEGSAADLASPVVCPAPIERALAERLQSLAEKAFRATGCRDYARVDFRLDARGDPIVLEVNPNPDLGPTAGWARAARAMGLEYENAVASIARAAWKRRRA